MSKRRCLPCTICKPATLCQRCGWSIVARSVARCWAPHAALGIELVGPLKQEGGWQHETGYGVSAFHVDWQKQQVRCPQGHLSQNWCPGRHNRGEEVIRVS